MNLVDDLGGIFGEGLERVFGCLRNVLETWNELMIYREYHMPFGKKIVQHLEKIMGRVNSVSAYWKWHFSAGEVLRKWL